MQQQNVLIAFCNLYGDHTGAAQALVTIDVLDAFKITPKFHCFVGDNVSRDQTKEVKVNCSCSVPSYGGERGGYL
jgi:hypothetical protein